tara:strand:+ start:550 stop:2349 length:1800 start_codon:yes stop_codon:yes gene_type:complete
MLTNEEILTQYFKCLKDPVYAIETYLETKDNTQGGFVPFNLFPRQKEIVRAYETHRFNLVAKPRQAGISTTTQAYMAIKCAFADSDNPETVLLIANKLKLAQKFLRGIKDYLLQMPRWVWGDEFYGTPEKEKKDIFLSNSKIEVELPNGCQIIAVATSEDALRGYTPTYLIFDEAAFIDNGDAVYSAAMSSCATGGKVMLISTPNGMDSLYYKTYEQSKSGKNNYNIIDMKWYEDPRYNKELSWVKKDDKGNVLEDIKEYEFINEKYKVRVKNGYKPTSPWYENMCMTLNNNTKKIAQELDVSFLGSGGNVISDEDIAFHEQNNVEDPLWVDGREGEYWIWEKPIEGHQYILSSDVARGDGEDSSTIVIVDFTTMEEVMEYQGKIPPDLLAEVIYEYGNLYKAYTIVDITGGMGVATVLKLLELKYKYLHYDEPRGKILNSKKAQLTPHSKDSKIPGFNANGVRLPMIANFERMVRENGIVIKSRRLVSEMKTFVYRNGRPDHMRGYHDDLIMAMCMALWVLEHSFKKLEKMEKQNKAMLSSWTVGSSNKTAKEENNTGFVSKENRNKKALKKPKFSRNVSKNMQDPKGDYLWLFSGFK